eukprot:TRINITY_DN35392_c0_g1_i1.p2 TRINITY_DN35392_c0_g1~~TRINITY_DN35392_c0_g1_i1.p2  ORF type:complete len:170 (+),score=43.39 TRINITY_DN35392_c0_g1_i1:56-565(+)
MFVVFFFFQAEDGIRDAQESRGLGDVYKRQVVSRVVGFFSGSLCNSAVALVNTLAAAVADVGAKLRMAKCGPLMEGLVRVALCSSAPEQIKGVASTTVRYLASINPNAQVQDRKRAFALSIVASDESNDGGSFASFSFEESTLTVSSNLLVLAHAMFAASPSDLSLIHI